MIHLAGYRAAVPIAVALIVLFGSFLTLLDGFAGEEITAFDVIGTRVVAGATLILLVAASVFTYWWLRRAEVVARQTATVAQR